MTALSAFFLSCSGDAVNPVPGPVRELSVPEKVEKAITDVLSKNWKTLSDTLAYFDSTLLSKGIFKGTAPDGVRYELDLKKVDSSAFEASFKIEDSTWVAINGWTNPPSANLSAFGTEISIAKERRDSSSLSVSDVKAVAPDRFFREDGHSAPLLYKGTGVGWLTREEFENTDYSTGVYVVAHYHNDPRTFAIYDNGLSGLLKFSLKDVFK